MGAYEGPVSNKGNGESAHSGVNLLRLIDLERDSIRGDWRLEDDVLILPQIGEAKLNLPYSCRRNTDFVFGHKGLQGRARFCWAPLGMGDTSSSLHSMRVRSLRRLRVVASRGACG